LNEDSGTDGGGQQGSNQGGHRDDGSPPPRIRLGPARPKGRDTGQRLLANGAAGADDVFGAAARSATPQGLMEGLAALMLGSARAGANDLAAIALAGQKAAVRRLGAGSPPTCLADVKSVLLAACARPDLCPPAGAPSDRQAHHFALLPLALLNPSRPRTPRMVDTASAVIDSLLRPHRP
jgi:hypothetical protein